MATSEGARSGFGHFFLNLLRIGAGLLFIQHGAAKVLGPAFGFGDPAATASLFWWVGWWEIVSGLAVALGLATRPIALLIALEMAYAYFSAHFPNGWLPLTNRGEPALMYLLITAFLAANGGGAFGLDGLIAARRRRSAAG